MRLFTTALVALMISAAGPTEARRRHRAPHVDPPSSAAPHEFYPNDVEGGSTGNLPFNNQIRKHTDPLNANGSR